MTIVYLDYVVPGSVLLPIAILLPKVRHTPVYAKLLFSYLLISALVNATFIIMARNNIPNLWIIHIYTALESFLLLWFFKYIIKKPIALKVIQALMIGFPLFCVFNFLFLQSIYNFNTYARPFEAFIFIALSMIYWGQESEEDIHWAAIPANWFVTGLLLYFSGAFFIFLFSNYLAGYVTNKVMDIAWYTHATLILLMYILFAIGFLKCKKQ
jgi:hypothetical protein